MKSKTNNLSTNTVNDNKKSLNFFMNFTLICLLFSTATIFVIFFEEDLFRLFTPFLAPFIFLFMFFVYLILTLASILYVPFQIKKIFWRVLAPIIINMITFCIVYYLFDDIINFRIETKFLLNEKRFNQASNWIVQSIQNGDINLDNNWAHIKLPREYRSLAEDGTVSVYYEYGTYAIHFYRGGGLFEFVPSYVYRSDNIAPPFEDFADTVCIKRLRPYWYDCY